MSSADSGVCEDSVCLYVVTGLGRKCIIVTRRERGAPRFSADAPVTILTPQGSKEIDRRSKSKRGQIDRLKNFMILPKNAILRCFEQYLQAQCIIDVVSVLGQQR